MQGDNGGGRFHPARASSARGFKAFGTCLGLLMNRTHLTELRLELFKAPLLWTELFETAARTNLQLALSSAALENGVLPPPSARGRSNNDLATALREIHSIEQGRRESLRLHLLHVVDALNQSAIVPTLIKGSVALWTGKPSWRAMRDVDLVLDREDATTAQRCLVALGYRAVPVKSLRSHHLPMLVHDDRPGWIEIHVRATSPRGETVFSSSELVGGARVSRSDRGVVKLPSVEHQLLHGLVHHHFSNRGAMFGLIGAKGLLEFAHGLSTAADRDLAALRTIASRHVRLLAGLDLWVAAAHRFLDVPLPAGVELRDDAVQRWQAMNERMISGTLCPLRVAVAEELTMILDADRLHRTASAMRYLPPGMRRPAAIFGLRREIQMRPGARSRGWARAAGVAAAAP